MDKNTFTKLVREFKFKDLFNQMGWDNASGSFETDLKGTTYNISVICEKSGFRFLQCSSPLGSSIPPKNDRLRIQSIVKRRYYEHMLIFVDETMQKQVWQYAYKPMGKPLKTIITEYYISQDPQLLYQRTAGLVFNIDEHENITLVDVTKRLNTTVDQNSEKVTKDFYKGFKKQHTEFLSFMTGITEEIDRNWYASVMLNRLMFCYFIQKRRFLDNNIHYLMNKLQDGQLVHGRDQFYSFYRNFLLQLFHEGLGSPDRESLSSEFGKIPYLNGGIFSKHELETKYEGQINITDDAFESLFNFFDEFNWHLDISETASGRDVNPDVIGYIFEKYINDRAQMGAYYTKEDITDYIGKNTILPYLFDEVQRKYPDAFKSDGEIWQKIKSSEDQYIYNAVKYGINPDNLWQDLPDDIKSGLDPEQDNLVGLRRCWNQPAPSDAALPTEIWREVIARRQRYIEVKQHITSGDIAQINDFITHNLDIRQFALDLINETEDQKLVFQFYNALKSITVLDPTCGSGAFLFAAMNILEDLYEACISRMRDFVADHPGHSTSHMKKELDIVDSPSHPNLEYFIYKSIILNNLYGVDIMNEAVEIAKLRLFLKLVACVDPDYKHKNYGLEPLPDIDFNIRCGNTLVGYANWEEIEKDIDSDAISAAENKETIPVMCQKVALAFIRYKEIQLEGYQDYNNFIIAKSELIANLKELTAHLDSMLYQHSNTLSYSRWIELYQPFHWFAEFYEIIHDNDGFNVIIGNPPYVEYNKAKFQYQVIGYRTEKCGNLYAFVYEKSIMLLNNIGRIALIIPASALCTSRMESLKDAIIKNSSSWISFYGNRPATLFSGAQQNLAIIVSQRMLNCNSSWGTKHMRWSSIERWSLFYSISYIEQDESTIYSRYGDHNYKRILKKISSYKNRITGLKVSDHRVYYSNSAGYWLHASTYLKNPNISRDRVIMLSSTKEKVLVCAILNSSLFYLVYSSISDLYHVTLKELGFITIPDDYSIDRLDKLVRLLEESLYENMSLIEKQEKTGLCQQEEFYPKASKSIIDLIDHDLMYIYGMNTLDLDYIINYDIKYRMGSIVNDGDNDKIQIDGE